MKRKSLNRLAKIVLAIAIIAVFILLVYVMKVKKNNASITEAQIIKYENGDTLFVPSDENLAWDKKELRSYYNNLLLVYTSCCLSDSSAQELADTVNGEFVGRISGAVNAIQIKVAESNIKSLEKMAERIMTSENVIYAHYEFPVEITPSYIDNNPWSESTPEPGRGKQDNPDGNDWWAEAIGAYSAWEIAETGICSKVNVGVIDNYFDTSHEDLCGKIHVVEKNELTEDDNEFESHGTSVSGIIGAKNDTNGIRGVADNAELYCIDYTVYKDGNQHNRLDNGEIAKLHSLLLQNGVKVINDSWGIHIYSEDGFKKERKDDKEFKKKYKKYNDYLEAMEKAAEDTARQAISLIAGVYCNPDFSDKEFLIVESAGNGYDDGGLGYEANREGCFNAVSKNIYDSMGGYNSLGVDYSVIEDRIMIVGATEKTKDSNGNYLMTNFSNYGTSVDICAPGRSIFSDAIGGYTDFSNNASAGSGTSEAAPMVSGSAALLWSINPSLSSKDVKDILINSAKCNAIDTDAPQGQPSSYPMLNIGEAAKAVNDMPLIAFLEPEKETSEQNHQQPVNPPSVEKPVSTSSTGADLRLYIPYLQKAILEQEYYDGSTILLDFDHDGVLELIFLHDNLLDKPTQTLLTPTGPVDEYTREISYSVYDIENGTVKPIYENKKFTTLVSNIPLGIVEFRGEMYFSKAIGTFRGSLPEYKYYYGIQLHNIDCKYNSGLSLVTQAIAKEVYSPKETIQLTIDGKECSKWEIDAYFDSVKELAYLDLSNGSLSINDYSKLSRQGEVRTLAEMIDYINSLYSAPTPSKKPSASSEVLDITDETISNDSSKFRKMIASRTTDEIIESFCYDYDSDGTMEAFVITRDSESNPDFPNHDMWFVNDYVAVVIEPDIGNATLNGVYKIDKYAFISVDKNFYGPGSWSLVYGIKDGFVTKMNVSETCGEFGLWMRDCGENHLMGSVGDTSGGARNFIYTSYDFFPESFSFEKNYSIEQYHYENGLFVRMK